MRTRSFFAVVTASLAIILFQTGFTSLRGENSTSAALTGQVGSKEEGPMEGVLVSAKRAGSTVTVVSDRQGRYSFPRKNLEPGRYSLRIRAVGYELDDPGTVEATPQKTATVDLKLHKAPDLASQLTNAEWLLSVPGTEEQKSSLLNCMDCHTLEQIVRSRHNTEEFIQVVRRMMGYAPQSSPLHPQRKVSAPAAEGGPERFRSRAEYLSTINLSSVSQWAFPLKTLPRPKGRATHVVITEYDLPRPIIQPHDVVLDSEGMVWYSDFGQQYLGRLDPKTTKVVEYPVPELKHGSPVGMLDLEFDKEGNLWIGMMLQAGIAKFDRKTQKFQVWSLPPDLNSDVAQQAMVMPWQSGVDGKIWMTEVGIPGLHRLDVASGKFETFEPYRDIPPNDSPFAIRAHSLYDLAADFQNNVYFTDFGPGNIGRVDAKTGKVAFYPTPTPQSRPRRCRMDSQDRLWFAEYNANRIGMFDTRTKHFQEWAIPTPWTAPYDVVPDKNGEVWGGGMTSDRVLRLDPQSGQFTEYLLPRSTNIRRVFVDNSTTPVSFWVGNNNAASIIKLEPLD